MWKNEHQLLPTLVARWLSSECVGVSSECAGVSSECAGVSSECAGVCICVCVSERTVIGGLMTWVTFSHYSDSKI